MTAILENVLRLAAVGQICLAVLNFNIVRVMGWRDEVARMPSLVREVFHVHTWFISITLGIFAALKEPINRTFVRLNKNASFLFSPEPGKYQMRIAISPLGEGAHLAVNGGTEVFEKDLTRGQGVIEFDIETTGEPITVNVDDYTALGWLTLIEKSAPSYNKPTGE